VTAAGEAAVFAGAAVPGVDMAGRKEERKRNGKFGKKRKEEEE
jgi:hypothetical protein